VIQEQFWWCRHRFPKKKFNKHQWVVKLYLMFPSKLYRSARSDKMNIPSFQKNWFVLLILVPWSSYSQKDDAGNIRITDFSTTDKWPNSMTTYQACNYWLLIWNNRSVLHKWLKSMLIQIENLIDQPSFSRSNTKTEGFEKSRWLNSQTKEKPY
jgi:hypothetical protein